MFGKNKVPKHMHTWSVWSDQFELGTRTSFNSTVKLMQSRKCETCGEIDSRTIETVHSS